MAEASSDPQRGLEAQMMTMDLDRARFVLRSYLRCRVLKVGLFSFFAQSLDPLHLYCTLTPCAAL